MTTYAEKLLPHDHRGRGGRPRLGPDRRRVPHPPRPPPEADRGMYFIWDFTQLNVRPHSRVGFSNTKPLPNAHYRAHSVIPA